MASYEKKTHIKNFVPNEWTNETLLINHNLGSRKVIIQVWDVQGVEAHVATKVLNKDSISISATTPFAGQAVILAFIPSDAPAPDDPYAPSDIMAGIIQRVRGRLRDYVELNRLLDYQQETSDVMIQEAIYEAIDDFNMSPPPLRKYKVKNFPSYSLLVTGAVAFVLRSAGVLITRNSLAYSDGGINVNLEKTAEYQNWLSLFSNEWEQKKLQLKMSINIRSLL